MWVQADWPRPLLATMVDESTEEDCQRVGADAAAALSICGDGEKVRMLRLGSKGIDSRCDPHGVSAGTRGWVEAPLTTRASVDFRCYFGRLRNSAGSSTRSLQVKASPTFPHWLEAQHSSMLTDCFVSHLRLRQLACALQALHC